MGTCVLPDNNYAYYSKDNVTIILSTKKYTIDDKFKFTTEICLVYAEEIEITSDITARGKSIGLFCHTLTIPNRVTILVSGENGTAGKNGVDQDGGQGGNGADSGNIWVCVQSLAKNNNPFHTLEIKAYGGDGGRGGDSTVSQSGDKEGGNKKKVETKGGNGGNGGNGGDIELLFGTAEMDDALVVIDIRKRSWAEQAVCLTEPVLSNSLPEYISHEDKQLLELLKALIDVLRTLASQLETLSRLGDTEEIRKSASSLMQEVYTNLSTVGTGPKNVTSDTINSLKDVISKVCSVNAQLPDLDASKVLAEVKTAIAMVTPQVESELDFLIEDLEEVIRSTLYDSLEPLRRISKLNSKGAGGAGSIGPKYGARGIDAQKDGKSIAKNIHFKGTKPDVDVLQAYIFPEQCQMLLNKADEYFFSSDMNNWNNASALYDTLLGRLQVLKAFEDNQNSNSGLYQALEYLETGLNITNNPVAQLNSIREQARSRRNRLLLGQDMFGHVDNWVPRLSFGFYAQSVVERFSVLELAENLTATYEEAFKKNNDVLRIVDQGISSMASAQKEAEAKIDLLTSRNGPLISGIYKISFLTTDIKLKRQIVKDKLASIQFTDKTDRMFPLIDAFSTLISTKLELSSFIDLAKKGYETYQKLTPSTAENMKGDAVKKEYIIDQLAQCGDTLDSLEKALKTKKNDQIAIDDPGAIKVIGTAADIERILREFKNAIPEKERKGIEGSLDDYVAMTLNRNNAILDYNASIQLLLEAYHAREYSKSQGDRLGQKKLQLDPNTPAIVFWLRKTRDNIRLDLMQRLNYESRAIRFWGLQKYLDYSNPGPLQSVLHLRDGQLRLNNAFESSLNNYASNIRVTWPRGEDDQGLFYELKDAELQALKHRQINSDGEKGSYHVSIQLEPGADPFGPGRADVRINQVRLWLLGVKLAEDNAQRKRLMVNITHTGNEILEDASRQKLEFAHDTVNIQFEYDTARVQTKDDFSTKVVFSRQGIESNWSGGDTPPTASTFAAIGPFTVWHFSIRESENRGLDMGSVSAAFVEFRGANQPFLADEAKE